MKPEILIVDDEIEVGTFFQFLLEEEKGYRVTVANSGHEAMEAIRKQPFHLALVDLKLTDYDGITLLEEIKKYQPQCQVIIMTGYSTVKSAVQAIKLGAFDYIEKPFDELDELESIVERALGKFRFGGAEDELKPANIGRRFGIIAGPNSPMQDLLVLAKKIASKDITVLLNGETGTGKEVLARFIHLNSSRANKPFFAVNCGAFTETLLESELFGHEKGAFTGAQGIRKGIFEIANGGTLFLDEIGEASPAIQVKLLRILETGEFMRVGGEVTRNTNVRILAATNVDLKKAVEEGNFREDLFYRLDVVTLNLPPLRERLNDIPLLVNHFLTKNVPEGEKRKIRFSPEAMELLKAYPWPGNVRELANMVTRAMALRNSDLIGIECLPEKITGIKLGQYRKSTEITWKDLDSLIRWWGSLLPPLLSNLPHLDLKNLRALMKEVEIKVTQEIVRHTLKQSGGSYYEAAHKLGTTSRVLRYIMNEKGK